MPKPRTLSEDDLKTLAFVCHEEIQWPAPEEGGFATATCNGHPYQARVAPQPAPEATRKETP